MIIDIAVEADFRSEPILSQPIISPTALENPSSNLQQRSSSNVGRNVAIIMIMPIEPTDVLTKPSPVNTDDMASETAPPTIGKVDEAKNFADFSVSESADAPTAPCMVISPTYTVMISPSDHVAVFERQSDKLLKFMDGDSAQIRDIAK